MARTKNILKVAGGKLPTEDTKNFEKMLKLVIDNWALDKPVDIMLANRLVVTFMKLKNIEEHIEKQGSFFEIKDGVKVNPLVYYARDLQGDLMKFYRLFQGKNKEESAPADFSSWLDDNAKEIKKTD